MSRYIDVKYYIETPDPLKKAVELIATMQSTGTWSGVKQETKKLIKKFGAKVKDIKELKKINKIHLPTKRKIKGKLNCAEAVISYPWENFGKNIAMLLSTVAGEVYDLSELTAIKVIDINFPIEYLNLFKGPKFGIDGSREIAYAYDRPLFGAITKPCVGLTPKQISKIAYEVSMAGIDFIKDDELLADASYNTIAARSREVGKALETVFKRTGKKTMYAFNITDNPDKVLKLHDIAVKNKAKAIMFNVLTGGFNTLNMLAKHTQVPIHCHRDFAVSTFRSPYIGITSYVFTKLTRLAGGDQIQCGGISGYLYEDDSEVLKSFDACLENLGNIKKSLPVSSGGMWAGTLPINLRKIKHNNFMFLSGGGIFGHPDGGYAGVKSILSAYEAIKKGIKLEKYNCEYLQKAIKKFGRVEY
ncbi:MAG: RuBisCO large subunit C-terminal-like domain-containing protein [Candidatus Goldbacteria bacterium]|nr:RuBisCO large subunit C-terminal-like domain-containing protein [Candidatus Goldiibacteriota bacterium]